MATSTLFYAAGAKRLFTPADVDFLTDTIKVALLTAAYTPNQSTHDFFDDVSANEVVGTGYTPGGITLSSKTVTFDAGLQVVECKAANISWPASTITARYAVIYKSTGVASTSPLIGLITFDTALSTSGTTLSIAWLNGRVLLAQLI